MRKKERSFSKKFDTLAGIPLLFALSGLGSGRHNSLPEVVNRVAFLKVGSPADIIFMEPAARAFKRKYPYAKLILFTCNDNIIVSTLIKYFDDVVIIYPEDIKKSVKIVKKAGEFDIWADFGLWSRFEAILSHFVSSKFKIGFKQEKEHRHFAYDKVVSLEETKHISLYIKELMLLINVEADTIPYIENNAGETNKLVVFNMFPDRNNQSARQWHEDNWKYLLSRLTKLGYRIAITGNKENVDEADKFVESVGAETDVDYYVGRLDRNGILELLSRTALVISIDSYFLHLASAVGVPVFGVFGPTSPDMYAIQGKNATGIVSDLTCVGCQNIYSDEECRLDSNLCMNTIDVNKVEIKILHILEGCR